MQAAMTWAKEGTKYMRLLYSPKTSICRPGTRVLASWQGCLSVTQAFFVAEQFAGGVDQKVHPNLKANLEIPR